MNSLHNSSLLSIRVNKFKVLHINENYFGAPKMLNKFGCLIKLLIFRYWNSNVEHFSFATCKDIDFYIFFIFGIISLLLFMIALWALTILVAKEKIQYCYCNIRKILYWTKDYFGCTNIIFANYTWDKKDILEGSQIQEGLFSGTTNLL